MGLVIVIFISLLYKVIEVVAQQDNEKHLLRYSGIISRIWKKLSTLCDPALTFTVVLCRDMLKVRLSKSGCIEANKISKDFVTAYLFVRTLHALVKHPIILDYKAKCALISDYLGITLPRCQKMMKLAVRHGLARKSGINYIFHSNNEDKKFKPTTRNDYITTENPKETFEQIIIRHHFYKQQATIIVKSRQTLKANNTSDSTRQKITAPQNKRTVNYDVTLSDRAAANLFHLNSSASGHAIKKRLQESEFIHLSTNRVEIKKKEAITLLRKNSYNVRLDKNTDKWYYLSADTFSLQGKQPSYIKNYSFYCNDIGY